jgi:hypothetical protein
MAKIFPAGTRTVRNLEPRFTYFLVVKTATRILTDLPLKEYFIYKYKVPVSERRGKNEITTHFSGENIESIIAINDTEYSTGKFSHPRYTNQNETPLSFPYKDLLVYDQENIGKVEIKRRIPSVGGSAPLNLAE